MISEQTELGFRGRDTVSASEPFHTIITALLS